MFSGSAARPVAPPAAAAATPTRSIFNHGHANPFLASPDAAVCSQSALVRSLSGELSSLFKTFDNGLCSVQVVRESLARMGLEETPELRRLLRQTPCEFSFTQLLQALNVKSTGTPISAPAGTLVRRAEGDIFGNEGVDGGEGNSGVRRGAPKMGVTHSGLDVVTWRDNVSRAASRDHGSDALSGIHTRGRGVYATKDLSSQSVSDAMHRGAYDPANSTTGKTWETTSRRQATEAFPDVAVHGNPSALPGAPSFKIKDQVYAAIRALDDNSISEQAFVGRLVDCGVEITHALQHLIAKHRANGTAKFQDFVQVVQPFFAKIDREYARDMARQQAQQRSSSGGGGGGASESRQGQAYYDAVSSAEFTPTQGGPLATQHHGDILSWSDQPSGLEERAKKIVGGKMLGSGKARSPSRKHLQENPGVFSWEASGKGGSNGGYGASHRAHGTAAPNNNTITSGNIISWHEADGGGRAAGGGPIYGSRSPGSPPGGALGGGQGRLHLATKLYGGTTPYGTDVDLGEGLDKSYGAGRAIGKGNVRSRNKETTGAWMVQPASAVQQQQGGGSRYGSTRAPFGTDVDVSKGANVGYAGGEKRRSNNIY